MLQSRNRKTTTLKITMRISQAVELLSQFQEVGPSARQETSEAEPR